MDPQTEYHGAITKVLNFHIKVKLGKLPVVKEETEQSDMQTNSILKLEPVTKQNVL